MNKSRIEQELDRAHILENAAGGKLVMMIVRRKFNPTILRAIIDDLRSAASILENLL
jgi:hypothetical protein